MRAVTYSRVSTADKQSPEAQAIELMEYCKARRWQIVEDLSDAGFSGGSSADQRPGLSRLMTLVRSRKVDVIVVTKLDRLFRSLKHLVTTLDEVQSLGVQFVSIGDQIDLSTAGGRLLVHLLASLAEFERALIRERTLAGLAHARRKGKRLGRPKTRPDEAIARLRSAGLSYSEIEQRLGCGRGAIYRALRAISKTRTRAEFQLAEKTRHEKRR